jgi:hypothetical protein
MKIELIVTMDDGSVLRGAANLAATDGEAGRNSNETDEPTPRIQPKGLDFSLPPRAFMKKNASDLSGPKKLTLMVACLAKGDLSAAVSRAEVENIWTKMKGLLGGAYNPAYDTRARDNGWISSPKAGTFQLREGWESAIE